MRDNQKQRVYDWEGALERSIKGKHPELLVELPIAVCKALVDKISEVYKITAPKVRKHRLTNGRTAHYMHFGNTITLPTGWACNGITVAHEMAHCLTSNMYELVEPHGAEFVRVFANVLCKFLELNTEEIENSIREAKLNVLQESKLPN